MKLTNCPRCKTTIARHRWIGLSLDLDLTALDNPSLAEAWSTGRNVWKVNTLHRRHAVRYYWASIHHARKHVGQPMTVTLLADHRCPGTPLDLHDALNTWQPQDAKPLQPVPVRPATKGVPF
jgi:hypothetical protein